MKKINVGILADKFINWGGGVDFLRLILNGLNSLNDPLVREINISVFIPYDSSVILRINKCVKIVLNKLFKTRYVLNSTLSRDEYVVLFKSINSNIEIIYYNGKENDLEKKMEGRQIDFVLPVFTPLSDDFPIKWAGYIYDFQHKYHPEFFSEEEVIERDLLFKTMVDKAETVIVNAKDVKNDIMKFIGGDIADIIVLPFCPVLNLDYFNTSLDVAKYKVPEKYFMISNQFWKHKDHITAFHAFKEFLENISDRNVGLVCTGQTFDFRFPNYFNELQELIKTLGIENKVYILGYIPKADQLQLLKKCVGVIQPTLFEGGPGGGAIYESVAYGIPSLVSDIPVNLEIEDETVTFFKKQSAEDLANKMLALYFENRVSFSKEELIKRNKLSQIKMGSVILDSINKRLD